MAMEPSQAPPLTRAGQALGLLTAEGASVALAIWFLLARRRLPVYVYSNTLPPETRRLVIAALLAGAVVAFGCGLALWVARRGAGLDAIERIARRLAPLCLAAFAPLLLHWQLWTGLILSVVAFVSYFAVFARFPVTRDVPWPTYLLLAVALLLLLQGVRRARRKAGAVIVLTIGVVIFAAFTYFVFFFAKKLPASAAAPRVGSPAPDFALKDSTGRNFSLASAAASARRLG